MMGNHGKERVFIDILIRIPLIFWASIIHLAATAFPIIWRYERLVHQGFPLYEGPDALMAVLPTYVLWYLCVPALVVDIVLVFFKRRPLWIWGIVAIVLIICCVAINLRVYS